MNRALRHNAYHCFFAAALIVPIIILVTLNETKGVPLYAFLVFIVACIILHNLFRSRVSLKSPEAKKIEASFRWIILVGLLLGYAIGIGFGVLGIIDGRITQIMIPMGFATMGAMALGSGIVLFVLSNMLEDGALLDD